MPEADSISQKMQLMPCFPHDVQPTPQPHRRGGGWNLKRKDMEPWVHTHASLTTQAPDPHPSGHWWSVDTSIPLSPSPFPTLFSA